MKFHGDLFGGVNVCLLCAEEVTQWGASWLIPLYKCYKNYKLE